MVKRAVVVGYDAWTEAVLSALATAAVEYSILVTDQTVAQRLDARDEPVVYSDTVDDTALREAGATDADAVLVATLDDQQNVLAVLIAADIAEHATIATFAGERRDAPKLRRAGADVVVNLGQVIGELVVETALTGADPTTLLDDLLAGETVVETTESEGETATDDSEDTATGDSEDGAASDAEDGPTDDSEGGTIGDSIDAASIDPGEETAEATDATDTPTEDGTNR